MTTPLPLSDEPERILYQTYVESFFDGGEPRDGCGDFQGLTAKLDYLKDLGVTGLLLMPICEGRGMGYIPRDFMLIRRDYANEVDAAARDAVFRALTEAAHARGIKVLLDLPINHISMHSTWFRRAELRDPEFANFFQWRDEPAKGWRVPWDWDTKPEDVWLWSRDRQQYYYALFGADMPDLNHRNPAVQKAIMDVLKHYASLGADGFRIDAAKHLVEGDDNLAPHDPENHELLKNYLEELRESSPHQSFMLEAWSNRYEDFEPFLPDAGDVVFDFAYMEALRASVLHKHPWGIRRALKHLEKTQTKFKPASHVVFVGNHDVPRIRTFLEDDQARTELAHALTLSLPFPPIIYYGDEIYMPGEYVRSNIPGKNRNGVCTPMAWTPEQNAGFTDASVMLDKAAWNKKLHADYKICNVQTQQSDPQSLFNFMRQLISLRRELALSTDVKFAVDESEPSDPVLKFMTTTADGRQLVAMFNFSALSVAAGLPEVEGVKELNHYTPRIERRSHRNSSSDIKLDEYGIWLAVSAKEKL